MKRAGVPTGFFRRVNGRSVPCRHGRVRDEAGGCYAWLHEVWRRLLRLSSAREARTEVVFRAARGGTRGISAGGLVEVWVGGDADSWKWLVLVHELAHEVARRRPGQKPSHGDAFCAAYKDLAEEFQPGAFVRLPDARRRSAVDAAVGAVILPYALAAEAVGVAFNLAVRS